MTQIENFGETQKVTVTVLVDNRADLILKSTDTVKRFTDDPLLAEHGFAILIELLAADMTILWDAGITDIALLENMRRMQIDPATIDKIALSHGHGDHTAAMTSVLKAIGACPKPRRWHKDVTDNEIHEWLESHRVPVVVHPSAFRERWGIRRDGTKYGPVLPPPRAEWEAAGAKVILAAEPFELGPGCWTTGAVPRRSFEKSGIPDSIAYREDGAFKPDRIEDDQAIVINVKDKGLVVVAGCAHSGIVNTVNCAREISGIEPVWAVIGGFHLARASDDEIRRTIDEMIEMSPEIVVPCHCTGFKAISQFASRMPDQFVLGAVGTKFLL